MIILIPMAGNGRRFKEMGYQKHKPVIPITSRRTGLKVPMVVASTDDIPYSKDRETQIIYIDLDHHKRDGVEEEIKVFYPKSQFITIDYVTQGQASTCLLAKSYINNNEELFISACDNGMVFDEKKFQTVRKECDGAIFTFRNNSVVEEKPEAYGWVKKNCDDNVVSMSVKIPISDTPKKDHAVVGAFWFKRGKYFVQSSEKMIEENDRINNEFYVDQVVKHCIDIGLQIKVFEIERYLCWGTPTDYENYEKTINYWMEFYKNEDKVGAIK